MDKMGIQKRYKWIVFLAVLLLTAWFAMKLGGHFSERLQDCPEYKPMHIAFYYKNLSKPQEFFRGKLAPVKQRKFQVPNIVHYIWYQEKAIHFRFDKALCILSAIKNLKPDAVYFHTNKPPTGKYFKMLKQHPVFKVVHRKPPTDVIIDPPFETLYADYDKVKILIEHGGIYLDLDVLAIRPFPNVRKYGCTVGLENFNKVCSGVIVCTAGHPFLYVWLDTYYDDYEEYKHIWAFHAGSVASVLISRYPHLIHIEPKRFHWPGYNKTNMEYIWGNKPFKWQDNYTIHTWIRLAKDFSYPNETSILTMNSTYGQIARQVYYGKDHTQLKPVISNLKGSEK